jgi:hypothetical protein
MTLTSKQNLRASRQTELTAVFSIGTVCRWLRNSVEVADAPYLTAMETEFERAAKMGACSALQNQVQQSETNGDEPLQTSTPNIEKAQEIAETQKNIRKRASPRGARNPATLPEGSTREYAL